MGNVNIVCRESAFGLAKCVEIISEVILQTGHTVSVSRPESDTNIKKYLKNLFFLAHKKIFGSNKLPEHDFNIFIEDIDPLLIPKAKKNYFIPNQEWFRYRWLPYLLGLDLVLAKTNFAQNIFSAIGCPSNFISFTSEDRFSPRVEKNYDLFFHLAGNSPYKGTEALLNLWELHPEWPTLIVIQSQKRARIRSALNIQHCIGYLDDQQLRHYQNLCGVHLCLSETEGFGHYIAESMSCEALVITTNAPPMNELVTPDRGVLVDYHKTKIKYMSKLYRFESFSLERRINQVLKMDIFEKKKLGKLSREWYLSNSEYFREALKECLL